jgi:hypothetical protein
VQFADAGRTFLQNLRSAAPEFQDLPEDDVYYAGVYACVQLSQNGPIVGTASDIGEFFNSNEDPLTEQEIFEAGLPVVVSAVSDLCPEIQFVLEDPELLVPTPVAIRSILGVSKRSLGDKQANRFANAVCQQLNRGTTESRLASSVADQYHYPDDLAQQLITFIEQYAC